MNRISKRVVGAAPAKRGLARIAVTLRSGLLLCGLTTALAASAAPPRKPDLADATAGVYHGDVISDARGPSRQGVTVTVTRIGPNQVSVASDYARIPPRSFRLQRVMDTIQNVGDNEVFLADRSKSPLSLMLTIDDAAWGGVRQSAAE